MGKNSFIIHYDKRAMIESLIVRNDGELSYERVGRLFFALMDRAEIGETDIPMDDMTRVAYAALYPQIDADKLKYEKKCEKYRENASLGGIAKATNRYQSLPIVANRCPILILILILIL